MSSPATIDAQSGAPSTSTEPRPTGAPLLSISGLRKQFVRSGGSVVNAIDDVSVEVHAGEVLVLLGPSGCGKTTLLRSIAGLEQPDQGRIEINGRTVFDSEANVRVPTEKRQLSMIFQSYALWPHMTVFENVAYPLQSRRVAKSAIPDRVREVLAMVGIEDLAGQHPAQMSGGQQQRVALARALVANDSLILFDEPLSNVDARVREQLRFELVEMQVKLGFAAVYVTHDQTEALALAHRVAVMGSGRVHQLGSPRRIYMTPTSRYVANFIGTTNEILGTVRSVDGESITVETPLGELSALGAENFASGDEVVLTIRPEHCVLSRDELPGPNVMPATMEASMFLGSHTEHLVRVAPELDIKVWATGLGSAEHGTQVWLSLPAAHVRGLRP